MSSHWLEIQQNVLQIRPSLSPYVHNCQGREETGLADVVLEETERGLVAHYDPDFHEVHIHSLVFHALSDYERISALRGANDADAMAPFFWRASIDDTLDYGLALRRSGLSKNAGSTNLPIPLQRVAAAAPLAPEDAALMRVNASLGIDPDKEAFEDEFLKFMLTTNDAGVVL